MTDLNIIDTFLDTFLAYLDSGFGLLKGDVGHLAAILIAIDVTLAALFWVMDEEAHLFGRLIRKVLYVGAFAFIITHFSFLAEVIYDSFAGLGLGALLLAGVTWLGLSPPVLKAVEVAEKSQDLEKRVRPPVETLGRLPKTYADAPVLGPPLPGDLGGPLLEAQRDKAVDVTDSATGVRAAGHQMAPRPEGPQPAVSGLFVAVAMRLDRPQSLPFAGVLDEAAGTPPISVPAGTILAATLITGLNSDLPGVVLAQITEAVFDVKGQRIVIPAGSRLIGRYERATMARQARINVRWETMVRPDGEALTLTDAVAADGAGYVGLTDQVDYHPGTLAKGVGLSTILALADTRSEGGDDLSRALREAAGRTFNQAGQRIVQQAVDMPATITVRPGWPVRIILVKGLALPVKKGGATNG